MEITFTILCISLHVFMAISQNVDEQERMKYELYEHYEKSKNAPYWDPEYNPHHGYEPYWVDGHWVFQTPTVKEGETTTPMPQVCGDECSYLYQPIREVCGRDVDEMYVWGCLYMGLLHWCDNREMDDHTYGYRTFNSYCEFLDVKCRDAEQNKHWVFVHVGPCIMDQDTVIKEIYDPKRFLGRMNDQYLPNIEKTASERNLMPFV